MSLGWKTQTHLLLRDCFPISLSAGWPSLYKCIYNTQCQREGLSSLSAGLDLSWSLWSGSLLITNDPMALYITLKVLDLNSQKNSYSANYILSTFLGSPYSLSSSWIWIISSDFLIVCWWFLESTCKLFPQVNSTNYDSFKSLKTYLSPSPTLSFPFYPLSHIVVWNRSLNSLGEEFHDFVFHTIGSVLLTYSRTQWFDYLSTVGSVVTANY